MPGWGAGGLADELKAAKPCLMPLLCVEKEHGFSPAGKAHELFSKLFNYFNRADLLIGLIYYSFFHFCAIGYWAILVMFFLSFVMCV